ncbi:MAG TPA: hydantoinase/oxoprolinase family protein [Methylomirabilota bacterium]|nr:hydantoinase/oxoprolinase family protein [Methylomirabilota bacterium]
MAYIIGVDIGGTFTDVAVVDVASGAIATAKVRTTPADLTSGVLSALELAAAEAGLGLDDLLADTVKLAHGTTLTSNVMFTWSGARTGLLATRGFGDEILIMRARGRVAGMGLAERRHYRATDKPPRIVAPELIEEVVERVDHHGRALVPLAPTEAERAVDALLGRGVESVAIALLWSPANPAHELLLERTVRERAPGVHVSVSHRLAPVLGEYERTATAAVNAYVGPTVSAYLHDLGERLRQRGLGRPLLVVQANGGVAQVEETVPINTIESGPAAGLVAAKALMDAAGYRNVIATDVGGTTFKVGLLVDGEWSFAPEAVVNQYTLLIPMIDVVSIGAGGGSIAWADETRLRIGPRSAGANPGPAGYGWGGTEPTVTDADLVLGFLNPERFLGGRLRLRPDLAEKAIADRVASRLFGGDVERAAAGIRRVVDAQMGDLVRKMSIERGHDPRRFVLLAYGGAGPLHAAAYARQAGIEQVIVPSAATVFSAFGAAASDIRHSLQRSSPGQLDDLDAIGATYETMEDEARALLARQGVSAPRMRLYRWADMRYARQLHDVRVPVPAGPVDSAFADAVRQAFAQRYAALYGASAVLEKVPVRLLRLGLEAVGMIDKPAVSAVEPDPAGAEEPARSAYGSARSVYWPDEGRRLPTRVYDGLRLRPGSTLEGPAIIELPGTTIALPPGDRAAIDRLGNTVITLAGGRSRR